METWNPRNSIRCEETAEGGVGRILIAEIIGFYPAELEVLDRLLPQTLDRIYVDINSPGGDYFVGVGIFNFLRSHPARVRTRCIGEASSAASIVFLGGEERVMAENSLLMVHNPWSMILGDDSKMEHEAGVLRMLKEQLARTYARHTNLSFEEALAWMEEETWIDAAAAVEHGFATGSEAPVRIAACHERADLLSRWRNAPPELISAFRGTEEGRSSGGAKTVLSLELELEEAIGDIV